MAHEPKTDGKDPLEEAPGVMGNLWLIMSAAFLHTATPGHSKSLIVAAGLSGKQRKVILKYTAGFALAHGIMMVLAILAGFAFREILSHIAGHHSGLVMDLSIYALLIAASYFLFEAWRMSKNCTQKEAREPAGLFDRRPFGIGLLMGMIPCPDSIGLGLIAPSLASEPGYLLPAVIVVWATVSVTILGMGVMASLIPSRKSAQRFRIPAWGPSLASACLCIGVVLFRLRFR